MATRTKPASTADIRDALTMIEAAGTYPPWANRGASQEAGRNAVTSLWVAYTATHEITGDALLAASVRWANTELPEGQTRRPWPSPADVLGSTRKAQASASQPRGCGKCTDEGLREVAIRAERRGRVDTVTLMAHCDCPLGAWWAQRRTEPTDKGGSPRPRPMQLAELVRREREGDPRCVVHVDPTPWQRAGTEAPRGPSRYGAELARRMVGEVDTRAGERARLLGEDREREEVGSW